MAVNFYRSTKSVLASQRALFHSTSGNGRSISGFFASTHKLSYSTTTKHTQTAITTNSISINRNSIRAIIGSTFPTCNSTSTVIGSTFAIRNSIPVNSNSTHANHVLTPIITVSTHTIRNSLLKSPFFQQFHHSFRLLLYLCNKFKHCNEFFILHIPLFFHDDPLGGYINFHIRTAICLPPANQSVCILQFPFF